MEACASPASQLVRTQEGGWEVGKLGRGSPREKVQVLWICRGVGVFPSRVIREAYRI